MNAAALLKLLLKQPRPTGATPIAKAAGAESFQALLKASSAGVSGAAQRSGQKANEADISTIKAADQPTTGNGRFGQVVSGAAGGERVLALQRTNRLPNAGRSTAATPMRELAFPNDEALTGDDSSTESAGELPAISESSANTDQRPKAARDMVSLARAGNSAIPRDVSADIASSDSTDVPVATTMPRRSKCNTAVIAAKTPFARQHPPLRVEAGQSPVTDLTRMISPVQAAGLESAVASHSARKASVATTGRTRVTGSLLQQSIPVAAHAPADTNDNERPLQQASTAVQRDHRDGTPTKSISANAASTRTNTEIPNSKTTQAKTIAAARTGGRSDRALPKTAEAVKAERPQQPHALPRDAKEISASHAVASGPPRDMQAAHTQNNQQEKPAVRPPAGVPIARRESVGGKHSDDGIPPFARKIAGQRSPESQIRPAPEPQSGLLSQDRKTTQPYPAQQLMRWELEKYWQGKLNMANSRGSLNVIMPSSGETANNASKFRPAMRQPQSPAVHSAALPGEGGNGMPRQSVAPQDTTPPPIGMRAPRTDFVNQNSGVSNIRPAKDERSGAPVHARETSRDRVEVRRETALRQRIRPNTNAAQDNRSQQAPKQATANHETSTFRTPETRASVLASVPKDARVSRMETQHAESVSPRASFWGIGVKQGVSEVAKSAMQSGAQNLPKQIDILPPTDHEKAEVHRGEVYARTSVGDRMVKPESSTMREPSASDQPIAQWDHGLSQVRQREQTPAIPLPARTVPIDKKMVLNRSSSEPEPSEPRNVRQAKVNAPARFDSRTLNAPDAQTLQAVSGKSPLRSSRQSSANPPHSANPMGFGTAAFARTDTKPDEPLWETPRSPFHPARKTSWTLTPVKEQPPVPDQASREQPSASNSNSKRSEPTQRVFLTNPPVQQPAMGIRKEASGQISNTTEQVHVRTPQSTLILEHGDNSLKTAATRALAAAVQDFSTSAPSRSSGRHTKQRPVANDSGRQTSKTADRPQVSAQRGSTIEGSSMAAVRVPAEGTRVSLVVNAPAPGKSVAKQNHAPNRELADAQIPTPRADANGTRTHATMERATAPSAFERVPQITPSSGAPLSDPHPVRARLTAQHVFELQTLTARAMESMRPFGATGNAASFVWNTEQLGPIRFRIAATRDAVQIEIESGRADVADILDESKAVVERLIADQGLRMERFDVRLTRDETSSPQTALPQFRQQTPDRRPALREPSDYRPAAAAEFEPERSHASRRPLVANYEWVA